MIIGIVDEDSQSLESLAKLIADEHPEISIAFCGRSAEEAMEMLMTTRMDVLVTGMKLADSGGVDLCKRIHNEKYSVEVMVLCSPSEMKEAEKTFVYGVGKVIKKPVTSEKVSELTEYMALEDEMKKGEMELRKRVGSVELTNRVYNMIKDGDKKKIHSIVFPGELRYRSGGAIKSYEIFLINILCFFLRENGYDDVFEEDIFAEMLNLVTDEQRMNFVMEKYSCVIDVILKREANSLDDKRITRVKRYIDEHFGNPGLSCDFLAERSGVSARHLRRLFVKTYGMGIQEYIMSVRMEKAKKLLAETVLPIETIIQKVGYNSSRYFRKLFKAQLGCTMSEYRNGKADGEAEE